MNLPNKLTMFRILLIPFILITLLFDINLDMETKRYIAVSIFIIASLTDALDGYIARKYNLITNFGKLMDPLADKLLVISTMLAVTTLDDAIIPLNIIVVIIIIAREFIVTGFRMIALEKSIVISAGNSGKAKTVCQMIMTILLLLNTNNNIMRLLSYIFIILSVILTIYSATEYIYKNKKVLKD